MSHSILSKNVLDTLLYILSKTLYTTVRFLAVPSRTDRLPLSPLSVDIPQMEGPARKQFSWNTHEYSPLNAYV